MKTRNGFATACLLAMTLTTISQTPASVAFTITGCKTNDGEILHGGYAIKNGKADYRATLLDESGNTRWDRTYGGDQVDELTAVCATSDGGFVLGGNSNSGISGKKSQQTKGEYDFWVVKINCNGEVEWDHTYGGYAKDKLVAIEEMPDGVIVLAGYSDSRGSLFENRGYDYMVVWTDASGNVLNQDRYGHKGKDILTSLTLLSDRSLLLGGYSQAKDELEFNLVKIDRKGDTAWEINLGNAEGELLSGVTDIEKTDDGGFTLHGQNETETWTMIFDRDGNHIRDEHVAQNLIAREGR